MGNHSFGRYTASTVSVMKIHWWLGETSTFLNQPSAARKMGTTRDRTHTWNSSVSNTSSRSRSLVAARTKPNSSEPSDGSETMTCSNTRYCGNGC